jgi:hypothetical protein
MEEKQTPIREGDSFSAFCGLTIGIGGASLIAWVFGVPFLTALAIAAIAVGLTLAGTWLTSRPCEE